MAIFIDTKKSGQFYYFINEETNRIVMTDYSYDVYDINLIIVWGKELELIKKHFSGLIPKAPANLKNVVYPGVIASFIISNLPLYTDEEQNENVKSNEHSFNMWKLRNRERIEKILKDK